MESSSSHNILVGRHLMGQLIAACDMVVEWNKDILSANVYLESPAVMEKMAASCMLIESIGEGVKKLDRLFPGFLGNNAPEVPWRSIKGLRDHIAHGYFNIDADIVFDVAKSELPRLSTTFARLRALLPDE